MPRRARPARTERALSLSALKARLRPVASLSPRDAENGGIEPAGRIGRDKLASLHALDIDNAHNVAGPDRDGDDAPARDGVALLAGRKRAQARLRDDGGPGRSLPEILVGGEAQYCVTCGLRAAATLTDALGAIKEARLGD